MVKRNRVRQKHNAPTGSTRSKGDIVEEIVAGMHESAGVKVEKNVFLDTQDLGRSRELGVLITSQVAGYPVYIAIECKNETKVVGVEEIDIFIGKLEDVGIPVQHGIFVSASGYTAGAIKRAHKVGIKPLVLKDVTEKLPTAIQQAFQSIIYLLAEVSGFRIRNNVPHVQNANELLPFLDANGDLVGSVPDLIWDDWRSGKVPQTIGLHEI